MCGLAGAWHVKSIDRDVLERQAVSMADAIRHRGPNDSGVWSDADAGIALAHRRLSIVDLSSAGHQPMLSASGRWVLAYNGEIYNHLELRRRLESEGVAPRWRGHSDTEILLAAIEAWGLEAALKYSVGMFALALWDRGERALWLARDRAGEKPLYYGWQGNTFLFGSELKALRAHPAFDAAVDRDALTLLMRHNCIPGPYSIYAGIRKLPPGTCLRLAAGQRDSLPVAYWSLTEVAERGQSNPFKGSDKEALDALEEHLCKAVKGQMVADVPVGALLSGGIDSTIIAALMQANSSRQVLTFTIGFDEREHDESNHARAVAAHLGTNHTEMRLSGADALALVPHLPTMYDEPFADSSQLPTHLVMKLARQHLTVALSGDAGDEFFGGYSRYFLGPKAWRLIGWIPPQLRRVLGAAMTAVPATRLNQMTSRLASGIGIGQLGDKLNKVGLRMTQAHSQDDFYVSLVSEWLGNPSLVIGGQIPPNLLDDRSRWPRLSDPVARMMALDAMTYLPDDILTKVDRASMAVSLETRAPFLDREVMEFAWTLPMSMKLRDGKGKWLLRQLLDRYVPRALVERPKMGFGVPLNAWLRGPLRDWAESLLGEERLNAEGYFYSRRIRDAWLRHQRGEASFGHRLWSVLMFQAWLEDARRQD